MQNNKFSLKKLFTSVKHVLRRAKRTTKSTRATLVVTLVTRKLGRLPLKIKLPAVALLLLITIPLALQYRHHQLYSIDQSALSLAGKSSIDTKKIKVSEDTISYDEASQAPATQTSSNTSNGRTQSATVATSTPDAITQAGYKAIINKDFTKGLEFGNTTPADKDPSQEGSSPGNLGNIGNTQDQDPDANELSFRMKPLFKASAGEYANGQIMFPVSATTKVFQTFKKNGVKEDIVLTKSPGNGEASYSWQLELGDKLEAKLLPDGSVGIYSANPNLYGNLQISDQKSQELVDKARKTDKSYQVFAIPAPFVKDKVGKTIKENIKYKLDKNTLTLEAKNLNNIKDQDYPISLDPSVVITTTADFATGYDDGMINYATANQVGRSNVSLGTVGATTQQTNAFTTARGGHTSVTYNGYLYIIGGTDGTNRNDIQRCQINGDGSVVTPCTQQTNAFTTARENHTSVAYNGYLYIVGGTNITTAQNDIQRCPINTGGDIGTCTQQTNAFTTARYDHTSVTYNGYLYIIGGNDESVSLNDIQRCPIKADGSVGTCVQQTNAFTTARSGHTSVAYNGYVYIVGGTDGTLQNDILRCPINTDGSVGTCVQQAPAFTARENHTSVAYNGYLYIIGGFIGTYENDILRCPINGNGSVGSCTTQASAFTTARENHTSVAYNGYLYIIGGNGISYQNDIQRLLVDTGTPTGFGAVGTTSQQTNAFTTARAGHTSVAYNGYLYIIGGCLDAICANPQNDIQRCPINSNGSVGTCTQQTNAFTTARANHTSVAYNGYLYIIGGTNSTNQNDIQRCPINGDGSTGTCIQQTNAFTTARNSHTSVAYNGYLYIIGGSDGTLQNDIQRCQINNDGSVVTPCTQQTNAFTTARQGHTSVAYNGYLYIIGGTNGTVQNDIQRCQINGDGSVVTPCTQQTNAFTTARANHTSVAYNGYLYIIGGEISGGTYQNDIQRCPINSGGDIGACVQQTAAFTTARASHTSVAYNGYVYIIGGDDGVSYLNDIQRLLMNSMEQKSHYERVIDLGAARDTVDSIQYNGTAKCGAGVQYSTAGSNGVFGALTTIKPDAVAGTTYSLSGQTAKRYIRVVITLTDQQCGTNSNVTDVTVNYTVLPPAVPTLTAPASGGLNTSLTPIFQLKTTDAVDIYTRYKIELYQSNCSTLIRTIDQTASQTGWSGQDSQTSTAYVTGTTLSASTMANHTYQAPPLSYNTTYCWKAAAIDPAGSNTFGAYSATQLFTTNQTPPAPTLVQPPASQTGVSITPELRLRSTDADSDYLRYKIEICSNSDCSGIVRTIDQTASQTGWGSQSQQSATAYSSGQNAIHTYQAPPLTANTQYWWRAYAIDPAGVNVFSTASGIGTFTTQTSATPLDVRIRGNVNIGGNVIIRP